MDVKVINELPSRSANAALVLSITEGKNRPTFALADKSLKAITQVIKRGDLSKAPHKTLTLHDVPGLTLPRVVLQRTAKTVKGRPSASVVAQATALAQAFKDSACENIVLVIDEAFCPAELTPASYAEIFAATFASEQYVFTEHTRIPGTAGSKTGQR